VGSGFRHYTVGVQDLDGAFAAARAAGFEIVAGEGFEGGETYIRVRCCRGSERRVDTLASLHRDASRARAACACARFEKDLHRAARLTRACSLRSRRNVTEGSCPNGLVAAHRQ
jgi:hypothetical protein